MFERYAIFYTPSGALATFGAGWLGWDSASGSVVPHINLDGIDLPKLTKRPRKYGFHATLKAPFRLADHGGLEELDRAVAAFATHHAPVEIAAVDVQHNGGFLALRPKASTPGLHAFAAAVVRSLDPYRAPLTEAEIARRRQARLTARQDRQMLDWGYPYIFDDFHFHLTLSGPLPQREADKVTLSLRPLLVGVLPQPFVLDAITLMGQAADGRFHQIRRYGLG